MCLASVVAAAVDLEPRTRQAYDTYFHRARREFLIRVEQANVPALRPDEIAASPAQEDGIIGVPGGLIHHWIGRAYVRGVSLDRAVEVSRSYASYHRIYKPIIESRLLEHHGNTYRVLMRLKEGEAGITAVFDIRSTIEYVGPADNRAHAVSDSEEIREGRNPGRPDEHLLPPGRDRGYLWRASTLSRFVQVPGGVYVEMETLGLSRRFPAMLGWIIEPIARRIGRKSAEATLREFRVAIYAREATIAAH